MRTVVTAGPTREYIDTVRFISNASTGRMGREVAAEAMRAGHDVTLLLGPGLVDSMDRTILDDCQIIPFISVSDLRGELGRRFEDCDALVMTAAVGDFRVEQEFPAKIRRSDGPITLCMVPTEDVLAAVTKNKRDNQVVVAFAVEDGPRNEVEARARDELAAKNADFVVVNTLAAIAAQESLACILSRGGVHLPWAMRSKAQLAVEVVKLL